jgi:hypothetical protein
MTSNQRGFLPISICIAAGLLFGGPTPASAFASIPKPVNACASTLATGKSAGMFSGCICRTTPSSVTSPVTDLSGHVVTRSPPSQFSCSHLAAFKIFLSTDASALASASWASARSNLAPEKGSSLAASWRAWSSVSRRGALIFSKASWASSALAWASSPRLFASDIFFSASNLYSSNSDLVFSSERYCKTITIRVATTTPTAENAANPRNTTIMVFQDSSPNQNIRLSLLDKIVFFICAMSAAGILAVIIWTLTDFCKRRRQRPG